jgi:chromate transporter
MGLDRSVSLLEASRFWWQLGWVSFGGPAGQIALLHRELVEQRRWLSERRYLHALNFCMLLPGPEATQLATYLGWLMHGWPGALIAGALFLLPSALLISALAWLYAVWGSWPLLASVFAALKPVVLAMVVVAAWRLARRTLRTPLHALLAAVAFVLLLASALPYPVLVLGAALVGWLAGRWRPRWILPAAAETSAVPAAEVSVDLAVAGLAPLHGDHTPTPAHARFSGRGMLLTLLAWGLATFAPLAALVRLGGWDGSLALMARFFSQVALVSFGGAYAVLPYVAQGAVEQHGWLSASQMLDGLALGETTPGPLIMVLAFVGFMGGWSTGVGGWAAAAVTVWFTFLPSFGFILVGAPLVEASRGDQRFTAPLTAITAALVGVIACLAVWFALPVLLPAGHLDAMAALLVLAALWLLLRQRWGVLPLIGSAALLGVLRFGLAELVQ